MWLIVLILSLWSCSIHARVPFVEMKGLDAMMKPVCLQAEECKGPEARHMNNGENIFSPIHGALADLSGTLARIRFFGPYAKAYKTPYNEQKDIIAPDLARDSLTPNNPSWLHPVFRIRSIENVSLENRDQEKERNFARQFEYPLDPISALIQWLFPSVDGVNFVANDREDDPVGKMGAEITLMYAYQKKKAEFDNLHTNLLKKPYFSNYMQFMKVGNKKEIGNLMTTNPELKQYTKLRKQKEDTLKALPQRTVFAGILKVVHEFYQIQSTYENFKSRMMGVLPNVSTPKDQISQSEIFCDILWNALKQDGTFGGMNDPLYPKHIALHALLGYLWAVADSKEQVIHVMKETGLMRTSPSQSRVSESKESAYTPEQQQAALKIQKKFLSMHSKNYTRKDYERIKTHFQKASFEEKAFAGYAYELYEQPYPAVIYHGQADAPLMQNLTQDPPYADCGETALRNFFNFFTHTSAGNFNKEHILEHWSKSGALREFYQNFPHISMHGGQEARNAWSSVVSGLNYPPHEQVLSEKAASTSDVTYNRRYTNIKSSPLGWGNILNAIGKLTGNVHLQEQWTHDPETPQFAAQITQKLDYLCRLFSRDGFKLDWHARNKKTLGKVYEPVTFQVNKEDVFTFDVQNGHFGFHSLLKNDQDWRKDVDKNHITINTLLSYFYPKERSSFLNPDISKETYNPINPVLNVWKSTLTAESYEKLILRFLYKKYGAVLDDPHSDSMIDILLGTAPLVPDLKLRNDWIKSILKKTKAPLAKAVKKMRHGVYRSVFGELLEENVGINLQDIYGKTALMVVLEETHYVDNTHTTVRMLLDKGAQVNLQDDSETTALMKAVSGANYCVIGRGIVKMLLDKGAQVNLQDHHGCTALIRATDPAIKKILKDEMEKRKQLAAQKIKGFVQRKYKKTSSGFSPPIR